MHTDRVCASSGIRHRLLPILDTHRPHTSRSNGVQKVSSAPGDDEKPNDIKTEGGRFERPKPTARAGREVPGSAADSACFRLSPRLSSYPQKAQIVPEKRERFPTGHHGADSLVARRI